MEDSWGRVGESGEPRMLREGAGESRDKRGEHSVHRIRAVLPKSLVPQQEEPGKEESPVV